MMPPPMMMRSKSFNSTRLCQCDRADALGAGAEELVRARAHRLAGRTNVIDEKERLRFRFARCAECVTHICCARVARQKRLRRTITLFREQHFASRIDAACERSRDKLRLVVTTASS